MLQEVRQYLENSNSKYKLLADKNKWAKSFLDKDLVIVQLNKGRASLRIYSMIQDRKLGPFKIWHKVGNNAYVVDLLKHLHISLSFNIIDIYPYFSSNIRVSI